MLATVSGYLWQFCVILSLVDPCPILMFITLNTYFNYLLSIAYLLNSAGQDHDAPLTPQYLLF